MPLTRRASDLHLQLEWVYGFVLLWPLPPRLALAMRADGFKLCLRHIGCTLWKWHENPHLRMNNVLVPRD